MPKSRGRNKLKGTERNPRSPPKSLDQKPRRSLREILSSPWARLVEISGLVASLFVFWDIYVHARPKIEVANMGSPSPFLVPFVIKNESSFFSLSNVRWTCIIENYEDDHGLTMSDNEMSGGVAESIGIEGVENYRCPVSVEGIRIKSLSVIIKVEYETLGWSREAEAPFLWVTDIAKPQWIAGAKIK